MWVGEGRPLNIICTMLRAKQTPWWLGTNYTQRLTKGALFVHSAVTGQRRREKSLLGWILKFTKYLKYIRKFNYVSLKILRFLNNFKKFDFFLTQAFRC